MFKKIDLDDLIMYASFMLMILLLVTFFYALITSQEPLSINNKPTQEQNQPLHYGVAIGQGATICNGPLSISGNAICY